MRATHWSKLEQTIVCTGFCEPLRRTIFHTDQRMMHAVQALLTRNLTAYTMIRALSLSARMWQFPKYPICNTHYYKWANLIRSL